MAGPRRAGAICAGHGGDIGGKAAGGGLGGVDVDRGEGHFRAGRHATQRRQVGGDDGGDLGIAAGGLTVGQQHDGQAVAGHLDGARRDAVGDDVGALGRMLEGRALEPHAHAVGGARDGVGALRAACARPAGVKWSSCGPSTMRMRGGGARSSGGSIASSRSAAAGWRSGRRSPARNARPSKPPMPPRVSVDWLPMTGAMSKPPSTAR